MWSLLCFCCWVGWENRARWGCWLLAPPLPPRRLLEPSFPGAGSPGREALARRALGGAFVLESPGFQELE